MHVYKELQALYIANNPISFQILDDHLNLIIAMVKHTRHQMENIKDSAV